MSDLITEENVSVDHLRKIFDAAYIDYSLTDQGNILIRDHVMVHVCPDKELGIIRLFSLFGCKPSSTMAQRLESANNINAEYIIIKAFVDGDNFWFQYDLILDGGLTPKALILAIKRYAGIPRSAMSEYASDMLD